MNFRRRKLKKKSKLETPLTRSSRGSESGDFIGGVADAVIINEIIEPDSTAAALGAVVDAAGAVGGAAVDVAGAVVEGVVEVAGEVASGGFDG